MYEVVYAQSARKALKRKRRSGLFPDTTFREMLGHFISGASLPRRFHDHQLQGALADSRECHIGFDVLVQYKRNEMLHVVTIQRVGTHSELFGE